MDQGIPIGGVLMMSVLIGFSTLFGVNAYAENGVARIARSLVPLNLSRPPSTEELMAAGQLGGQLYPTFEEYSNKKQLFNQSFGGAIEEWNKHNYKQAVNLFRKHIADYPDSPWVSEARLHVGCDALYNGRYSEAETEFTWIINNNKDDLHEGALRLKTKAMLRLGTLRVVQNNLNDATKVFAHLKQESLDWRERTYASHWIQRISALKSGKQATLRCGTKALAYLLRKEGKENEANEVATLLPEGDKGYSMSSLQEVASRYGLKLAGFQLSLPDLSQIPLPAIMQLSGQKDGDRGHYWVLEKVSGVGFELYDPQSGRRFTQTKDELSKEWTGETLLSASKITENLPYTKLSLGEMQGSFGGCCGVPLPEDDLGSPGNDNDVYPSGFDGPGCGTGNPMSAEGSPIWKVNKLSLNFFMTDIPLWYDPPFGPPIKIQLSYNSQSAIAQNEPFGNKWTFNYGSYLVVDTGGNITIFMPDGRRDIYTPDGQGGFVKPFGVFNTLTQIAANHFELAFLDGTTYVYNIPAGTSSQQPFLVGIRDVYGQSLAFGYDANVQLRTITDAVGKVTNLTYNAAGLIERIDDPFARFATFEYDTNGNLTRAVDMGGYWTQYAYDDDVYLVSVQNARGTWNFYFEPADGIMSAHSYPVPGGIMWENYRITITNPMGGKEEYFATGAPPSYNPRSTQYVSPRLYIPYVDQNNNNYTSSNKYSYQFTLLSMDRWRLETMNYPEGKLLGFLYDDPTISKPTRITDSYGIPEWYTYYANERMASLQDRKGNISAYSFYPNGVDVYQIKYNLASTPGDDNIVLRTFTYNGNTHDIASIADAANRVTAFSYNSYGQIQAIVEAQGTPRQLTTEFIYDPTTHYLTEIQRNGNTVETYTRDTIGRIHTATDNKGVTLTYDYNDINQITKITYPDSRFETFTYSTCCPRLLDSKTSRGGLTTSYTYDALNRLTEVEGPDGIISYEYDPNGNLTTLIDPGNNQTSFVYDHDDRVSTRLFADGKSIAHTYDSNGRLYEVFSSKEYYNRTELGYDLNGNITLIAWESMDDPNTFIELTYDDYNRLKTRRDAGVRLYQYEYYPDNSLHWIDGPWNNDTITFTYDELGRLKTLTPQGGTASTYNYDGIGRLENIQIGTNTYTYGYTGVNPLVQSLTRPNGSITSYLHNDPLMRLTNITNRTSSSQTINAYSYAYNNHDVLSNETITNQNPVIPSLSGTKSYTSNNLNQLTSSTNPNRSYDYDDDGNMTVGFTPEGYSLNMSYDTRNRLISAEYTDNLSVPHRTEYYYDGNNLLVQIKKYDNGTPVSDRRYVRVGFLPIQERDGNNNVTREYTWGLNFGGGIGGLLNLKQGGSDFSYLYNGRGDVTKVIDGSQATAVAYTYDAFGILTGKSGALDQPYQFSTKEYDPQTGLVYFGYRFYSPSIGRWITRDPIGETGGINLYAYVANNPVNGIDPEGEIIAPWIAAAVIGSGFAVWAVNWWYQTTHPANPNTCEIKKPDKPKVPNSPGGPRNFPPYDPPPMPRPPIIWR